MTKLWIKEDLLQEWFIYQSKEYFREYQHRFRWIWSLNHVKYTLDQVINKEKPKMKMKIRNWEIPIKYRSKEEQREHKRMIYRNWVLNKITNKIRYVSNTKEIHP